MIRAAEVLLLLSVAMGGEVAAGKTSLLRGPFMKEEPMDVDPDAMVDDPSKLTDEQLHLSHGTLTPAKLEEMKKEMATLQDSLSGLMDKQAQLTTMYKMEREREAEEKVTKRKVREQVARSILKHLESHSEKKMEFLKDLVHEAVDTTRKTDGSGPGVDSTGSEDSEPEAATGSATGGSSDASASI